MNIRYSRQIILPELGEQGQAKLNAAKVLVVGAGGLGCPVLQYLTAAGVGTIGIIDGDTVNVSNLQRQILYSTSDEGRLKVEAAKEKLLALNPDVTIHIYAYFLSKENILDLILSYDIIVDGSDNFATRYLINDACVLTKKVHVYGALFKFDGQVSVFNYQNGPTYRCLFPQPPAKGEVPNCAEIGVIGVLPGIVGCFQANEVIKIITGMGEVLSGKLWLYNALQNSTDVIKFFRTDQADSITTLGEYEEVCVTVPEIDKATFLNWNENSNEVLLVDVREKHEVELKSIGGMHMPLSSWEKEWTSIPLDKTIVIHCASGIRSKKAATLLIEKGYPRVYSLLNGLMDF
ncbi:MAG: HesA/MoeB/ThiF family protein [Cytophagaceae bacterium]|jgi:adenylyltransferase/sulfurtransferase|nr:HesA/MoeB/ThiF family protein [Cytophagaceae bacterium]